MGVKADRERLSTPHVLVARDMKRMGASTSKSSGRDTVSIGGSNAEEGAAMP
jgi:hypothetical protein